MKPGARLAAAALHRPNCSSREAFGDEDGGVLADLPDPPYVAVIFSAVGSGDTEGYEPTLQAMRDLAQVQPGFLGIESAGGGAAALEVTVSYWASDADARAWKAVAEHGEAQRLGRERWYESYRVRVARVDRAYGSRT